MYHMVNNNNNDIIRQEKTLSLDTNFIAHTRLLSGLIDFTRSEMGFLYIR